MARFDDLESVLHDLGGGLEAVVPRVRSLLHLGDDGDLDEGNKPLQIIPNQNMIYL